MKHIRPSQTGFIPMIIMLLLMIVAVVGLAYWRVSSAN
jgi:hypothetical protein